jgi:hypothetical protein
MPLYEIGEQGLRRHDAAGFAALGIYERTDLQRLLRDDIAVLAPDLLVIAEEFGNWENSRRRIDLLAIDKVGHLVVIELKRTDDGGHMDLQALRYAAMVSSMSFDDVVEAFTAHCARYRADEDLEPRSEIEAFLDSNTSEEPVISTDVRILLVSADFGREITTTVLWLNGFDGMDIRCVRLVPYDIDGKVFLDIQQVLPLPEAADYQVKLRRKEKERARISTDGRDFTQYHVVVDGKESPALNKRNAARVMIESLAAQGVPLEAIREIRPAKVRVMPGHATDPDAIALWLSNEGVAQPRRWFTEHPLYDEPNDRTYVVSRMWGRNTEPTLTALSQKWPEAKVSFRAAD